MEVGIGDRVRRMSEWQRNSQREKRNDREGELDCLGCVIGRDGYTGGRARDALCLIASLAET